MVGYCGNPMLMSTLRRADEVTTPKHESRERFITSQLFASQKYLNKQRYGQKFYLIEPVGTQHILSSIIPHFPGTQSSSDNINDMDKSTAPSRRKKKTLNACQRCRTRKIKCSGLNPCQHCTSRGRECVFDDRGKRLVVTEEYLQALQARASVTIDNNCRSSSSIINSDTRSWQRRQDNHNRPSTPSSADHPLESSINGPHSPDAIGDEYRRLGHSSSWSFSRRIRNFIGDCVGGHQLHDSIPIRDGAYGIPWQVPLIDLSTVDLPTEEYAEYLTNTLFFAMDPLYYLLDKQKFLLELKQFYSDMSSASLKPSGLWHIQMLVVFAFGTSLLSRDIGPRGPTGSTYFAKAMEAFPDNHRLRYEPILAIEILCMVALFSQAMDMRRAAYDYAGQAVRIGLTEGLNRRFDPQRITRSEFEHRSKLWWTIYTIERRLSSLVGVPSALHDEDIPFPMPVVDASKAQEITVAFHVELSCQLGHILTVVYGLGLQRQLGAKFIAAVQSILRRLADTSAMLNTNMKIELQRPVNGFSRAAASLHLLQHQCTILTVRPILFFLLETKLASANSALALSDAVIGLLRVCVESALQVLKIVEGLRSHKLIDTFLPFDLDAVFASAFVLILIDIIAPATMEQWDLSKVFSHMDELNLRGVIVAIPYKKDLLELDTLRQRLKGQQAHFSHNETYVIPPVSESTELTNLAQEPEVPFYNTGQDLIWSWMSTDTNELGVLHPDTIQSAIDGLNFDFLNDPTAFEAAGSEWMWGSAAPGDTSTPNHNV